MLRGMPDRIVPGKTPVTSQMLNELLRTTEQNSKLRVAPGLDLIDMGSAGKAIVQRNRGGTGKPSGFFARLYVFTDPANPVAGPQAYWVEQQSTIDQQTGLSIFIDKPGGKAGLLGPLHTSGSAVQNVGPRSRVEQWVTLGPTVTGGTFGLAWQQLHGGVAGATGPIPANASAALVQTALEEIPAIGPGRVAVWSDPAVNGGQGGPWLVEFPTVPWYPDPLGGSPEGDPNLSPLLADGHLLTSSNPALPPASLIGVSQRRVLKPGVLAFNLLPEGEIVWVEPVGEGPTREYLFQLPYAGMYIRIASRGPVELVAVPGVPPLGGSGGFPPYTVALRRYGFLEVLVDGTAALQDRPDGLSGTNAVEINHNLFVPPGSVVWAVPLFIPGLGGYWLFDCPPDTRLVQATQTDAYAKGVVLTPRGNDGACWLANPADYFGTGGPTEPFVAGAVYYGTRVDLDGGLPVFVAPPRIGPPV